MVDGAARLQFREFDGDETRVIEFVPLYLSVADDFAEDYAGLSVNEGSKADAGGIDLRSAQKSICQSFPSSASEYNDLQAFELSAMEWRVRFICQGTPKLTVTKR